MFISARRIRQTTYYYLEDRAGPQRISILLGTKKTAPDRLKTAFMEWRIKKTIENAKIKLKKFRPNSISFSELVELERLQLNYAILQKFFPEGYGSFKEDEFVRYAQGSTSVEGNSLNMAEARQVLEGISVAGKSMKEIREIENMQKAARISASLREISGKNIRKIHAAIMDGFPEKTPGQYRKEPIFITASEVKTTPASRIAAEIKELTQKLSKCPRHMHPVEWAAAFHARFEHIHPFLDGNGRTGREILNFMLSTRQFPRAIISLKNRTNYISALERAQLNRKYETFSGFLTNCLSERNAEIEQTIDESIEWITEQMWNKTRREKK